jgi:hypothetical protein
MNQELERYLNDHLAGSCAAVVLIKDLAARQETDSERDFFLNLQASVEDDQVLLRQLMETGEMKESKALQVVGAVTAKAGQLKLRWEGLEPGELGMFEALEMLSIGIQGKRLLWIMLGEIDPRVPGWHDIHFADLESAAIRQRDAVEVRRLAAGREAFIPTFQRAE